MPDEGVQGTQDGAPGERLSRDAAAQHPEAEDADGASQLQVFDRSILLEILAGEENLIGQVVERYLGFVTSYLDLLVAALFAGEILQVRLLAIAVKGAAINIGALQVSEAAARLEEAAEAGDLDRSVTLFDQLMCAVETFCSHTGLR